VDQAELIASQTALKLRKTTTIFYIRRDGGFPPGPENETRFPLEQ
jgi:hypothetical protein